MSSNHDALVMQGLPTRATRTGMLETHLRHVQAIEQLTMKRIESETPPVGREQQIVDQIRRQAIGLQRLFRRWIRIRLEVENTGGLKRDHEQAHPIA